ncbi:hypothetical protein HOD38_05825 [archaeon]|jgi:hypothetical protein|nr:hypothetical protein [archaeon]MBT4397756.1 hypothetical protein [archaeon]MBT4440549.1 hypothetical protein [archaeon]
MKRGQATIFIIIAAVVVFIVILGFIFKDQLMTSVGLAESSKYPTEVQEVGEHVQDCVEYATKSAVVAAGYQGNYFDPEEVVSFYDDNVVVPYYYYNGYDYLPSVEDWESELSIYVEFLTLDCVDFSLFPEFELSAGDMDVETSIGTEVEFEVEYPIDAAIGDNQYSIYDPFFDTIAVDLSNMHTIVTNMVENEKTNPESVDLDFLLAQGLASIEYVPYNDGSYVYMLEDNTAFNGEEVYIFMFATYIPLPEEYDDLTGEEYMALLI